MTRYDDLFKSLMEGNFVSASMNYENYKDRTDDELDSELKDLDSQSDKHFRADKTKKAADIKKEIEKRKQAKDK